MSRSGKDDSRTGQELDKEGTKAGTMRSGGHRSGDLVGPRKDDTGIRQFDDLNREAYRELERAGIMYAVSGFRSGPEYLFRWTDERYARRFELSGCAPAEQ